MSGDRQPVPPRGLHPGAWLGRLLARALREGWPRGLLLNGLSPRERLDLALAALDWGQPHEQAAREVLARFAGQVVAGETPEAEAAAIALSQAVGPAARTRIHAAVRERTEGDDRSLAYGLRVFRGLHQWLSDHAGGVAGKRLLELGPGYTLVPALLLVASGAESWTGADLYPLASLEPELYRGLRAELLADRDLVRLPGHATARAALLRRLDELLRVEGERVVIDPQRVSWRHPVDGAALPFPDASFEAVLSNATFEHVRDPARSAREAVRVLVPGGIGVHQIDLRDHRSPDRPLEFLRLARPAWEALFEETSGQGLPAFTYTNRWRKSDLVRAFEQAGAEVLRAEATERCPVDDALRAGLDPEFRDRDADDLETVSLQLVVRRPAQPAADAER